MNLIAYIPGTNAYTIREGLHFVRLVHEGQREQFPARTQAYNTFMDKIRECQEKGCKESQYELSCLADKVSPALGHVDCVWKMLATVKNVSRPQ